jgi:uncharacterized protein (DUF305 family)
MKNRRITTWLIAGMTLVSTFAGGYAVNRIAGANSTAQANSSCSSQLLRQAMDDMHQQMHAVKSTVDVDKDFVLLMLPHHQAAIEMAKVELLWGKDADSRRLAQEIIADQQSEIELMRLWLENQNTSKPESTEEQSKDELQ